MVLQRRTLLIATAAAVFVDAPGSSTLAQTASPARSVAMKLYDAFNGRSVDAVDGVLSDDWEDMPAAPGQGRGREAFKPVLRTFWDVFPDLKIEIHQVVASGGDVAVRGTLSGTATKAFLGIEPGSRIAIPTADFHRVENGLIVRTWHLEGWHAAGHGDAK